MEEIEDLTEGQRKLLVILQDEHKKLSAEERKNSKQQRAFKEEERRLGIKLSQDQKDAIIRMKEQNRLTQEYARHIDDAAGKVGSTLKNAFVIGTAAITALNYKLMGVVGSFQEFERQLINAQSIWQTSNEQLFNISDSVVEFGTRFGVEMGNATEGLYQYASAGVDAQQAMEMLTHTLKLSMAVQGDHNTLSKLTTQTIMGFNMEFGEAEQVTDKFAHAINKSLIEWDDLASSIKFALPFFISTGQSIDQLLGGLQVLTNRALEAGIAGRGLRQALAEFTQHADDNSAAFRKLGIEILDLEGNMKPLNVIAQAFNDTLGDGASDMEVMMTLMEDLNVRGATAFVHLAQNADEFTAAVNDLQNSAGSATKMAEVQQTSLANQIQVVKNALMAPFILSDEVGQQAGYLNMFAMELHGIVEVVEGLFIQRMEDGSVALTRLGELMRDFVIGALHSAKEVLIILVDIISQFAERGHAMTGMLHAFTIPLIAATKLIRIFGDGFLEAVIAYKLMSGILPINNALLAKNLQLMHNEILQTEMVVSWKGQEMSVRELNNRQLQIEELLAKAKSAHHKKRYKQALDNIKTSKYQQGVNGKLAGSFRAVAKSQMMVQGTLMLMALLTQKFAKDSPAFAAAIGAIAGAIVGLSIALHMFDAATDDIKNPWSFGGFYMKAIAAGMVAGAIFNVGMQQLMKPPDMSSYSVPATDYSASADLMDSGGRFMASRSYDMGGRYTQDHGMAILQKGETVIPKTQNMLDGSGGITLNIQGDVYDSDNFAEKISEVLPVAVRKANDIGGI